MERRGEGGGKGGREEGVGEGGGRWKRRGRE
jgi:hypothetical protein